MQDPWIEACWHQRCMRKRGRKLASWTAGSGRQVPSNPYIISKASGNFGRVSKLSLARKERGIN